MNRLCQWRFRFITARKSVIIIIVHVFLLCTFYFNSVQSHMHYDYPETLKQEAEKQFPAGAYIKLKCSTKTCNNISNDLKWDFKACAPDVSNTPRCHNNEINEWIQLSNKVNHEKCLSVLIVENATANNSGMYRCYQYFTETDEKRIIKVEQIHVIERLRITDEMKPNIVDIQPINTTKLENEKIVVQCIVHSLKIPPSILWVKHLSTANSNLVNLSIPYKNKTYLSLKSSQKELDSNMYISKLIIEKSNENDTGIYTCLAVNLFGNSSRDVFVEVLSLKKDFTETTTSFYSLFLIPLVFALIPLTGWLCVVYCRKKKLRRQFLETTNNSLFHKYEPVLNRYNISVHNNSSFQFAGQRIV